MPKSKNKLLYRRRDPKSGKSVRTTFTLAPSTMQGLDMIRKAFRRRWPEASFPTISAVLQQLISKDLKRLSRPEHLKAEVESFEKKYPRGTKPAIIQPEREQV
jgi:hypothetical protein